MATAQSRINRAMRLVGALASGESPSADETTDVLAALNGMLDAWRNERLMVYAIQDEALSMTGGDGSYTIGPSGDLNTTRPVKIESAFVRSNGVDYPVDPLTASEYAAIPDKASQSYIPEWFYYAPTMATGTLKLYPVPSASNTLYLQTWVPLASIHSAETTVTLPPGWEDAIDYNLAVRIAPEFEKNPSAIVLQIAAETKAQVKRINAVTIKASTGLEGMFPAATFDITTG